MNYRHAFHAGNHADVLKHLVLTRLLALLSKKEAPFAYLDSHAGLGLYDLQGDQASRTGEYLEGIARLWQAEQLPDAVEAYLEVVRAMNPDGELRYYPGSPELARHLTREQDRVLLIRQYRHPVSANEWEIPAGLLDIAGEDPLVGAQRELAEALGLSEPTASRTATALAEDLVSLAGGDDVDVGGGEVHVDEIGRAHV